MTALVFASPDAAVAAIGQTFGPSDWLTIDQARIDAFAQATGDFQWIHVDPARARSGPFGTTIAHGYLTFSLINLFMPDIFRAEGMSMGLNYGVDRLRFPAPVPSGARIRASGVLSKAEPIATNGVQTTARITIEIDGSEKPGCVADILGRYYF